MRFSSHGIRLFFLSYAGKRVEKRRQEERRTCPAVTQSSGVVTRGAACSYCPRKGQRLDGSYLRTFALELKEQLAQTLAAFVSSVLTQPRRHLVDSAE